MVLGLSQVATVVPGSGIYLRFDNSAFTDTNFTMVCGQAGVYSATSLGVAPSNAWHSVTFGPGTNANSIKVTFDGTTTDNLCSATTIPTTALAMVWAYTNVNTTSGNKADLDFWSFQMPLTR